MRLHRFFVENLKNLPAPQAHGRELVVLLTDGGILHQLRDVFRLGKGDKVVFFDGKGIDYVCEIKSLAKDEGVFEKLEEKGATMPGKKITLLLSMIKKDNFELVLQKCTELGVSRFVPVLAERSEKKNLDMERARRIIKEASEQCGRGGIPRLDEIANLEVAIAQYPNIIAFDASGVPLPTSSLPSLPAHSLLIGPEGGWSEKELKMFKDSNIPIFNLGALTLRAETAAIAVSALLLT